MDSYDLDRLIRDTIFYANEDKKKKKGDEYYESERATRLAKEADLDKNIFQRNAAGETQNRSIKATTDLEGMKETGMLARQGLTNQGNTDVANIQAGAHIGAANIAATGNLNTEEARTAGLLRVKEAEGQFTKNNPGSAFMANAARNPQMFADDESGDRALSIANRLNNPNAPAPIRAPKPEKPMGGFESFMRFGPGGAPAAKPVAGAAPSTQETALRFDSPDTQVPDSTVPAPQPAARKTLAASGSISSPTNDEPGFLRKTYDALRPTNPNPANPFLLTPDQVTRNRAALGTANTQAAATADKFLSPEEKEKRRKKLNFNY